MKPINTVNTVFTWLIFLLAILLFVFTFQAEWGFTPDDTFITLRYSEHLAEGYGIVWNIGERPLEGYSNFSYLLLGALFYLVHWPIVFSICSFSVLCFIGSLIFMYCLMRRWVTAPIALLPVILLLLYPDFMLWAVSGMETAFFQLLIIGTVYALVAKKPILAGIIIAMASLTRPEGPLFFFLFLLVFLQQEKKISRAVLHYALAFTCIYLPYFLFRLCYFGELFPNPVYCKFMGSNARLRPILDYLAIALPFFIASIPVFWLKLANARMFLYCTLLAGFACLIMLYSVDPIVGYLNRYAIPFLSLLAMTAVLGLAQLPALLKTYRPDNAYNTVYILLFFLLFFSLTFIRLPSLEARENAMTAYQARSTLRWELADWLKMRVTPSTSIVLGDCGIIPFHLANIPIIDSLCLNSWEMTHSPINESYPKFITWVLEQKHPNYIILVQIRWIGKQSQHAFIESYETQTLSDPRFQKHYRFIKKFATDPTQFPGTKHAYEYWVYSQK